MNKVSVLVAFVCNPYLAVLFKRMYLKYWKDEIDELLINVNGRNDMIRKFIIDLYKDDSKVVIVDEVETEIRQGEAFNRIYPKATGDVIITMDSDNFVYKKGIVKSFVNIVRSSRYTSVGSFGFHANPREIGQMCIAKYSTARLNPFMAFFRREIIEKMDVIDFRTQSFKKGEFLPYIGTMPMDGWMDVMTPFCLRYFKLSDKKLQINASVEGEYHHVTGISSLYRRCFKSLEDKNTQKFEETDITRQPLGNWRNCYALYELTKDQVPFKEYNEEFIKGLEYELTKSKLQMGHVRDAFIRFKDLHKGLCEK